MIYSAIETGAKFGMISLDRAMADLVNDGLIRYEDALTKSSDPEKLKQLTGRGAGGTGRSAASAGSAY
jgi:twitching motility protein PilT